MNWIQGVFFITIYWTVSATRFRQTYESPERSFERRGPRDYYSSYHKPHHMVDNPDDVSRYSRPPRGRGDEPDESPVDSRYVERPRPRVSRHHYNPRVRPLDSREHYETFEPKRYRRLDDDNSHRDIGPRSPPFPSSERERQRPDVSDKSSRADKLQLQKNAFEKLNRLDKDARKNLHKTIAKLAKVNDAIKANVEKIPKIVKKTCAMRKEAINNANTNPINANEKILIFKRDTKSSSKSSTEESSSFSISSDSKSKSDSISSDTISLSSFSQSTEESAYSNISGDLLISESTSNSRLVAKSSRRYTRPHRARAPPRTYPSRYSREPQDHHRSYEHQHNSRYHHSASY